VLFFNGDMRQWFTDVGISYDQRNALVVGIAMGFAVIPTIFSIAEDAIFTVPKHLTQGSLALGATRWQTVTRVVLLTASPGIFSAIMIGMGRAVGETMIVLMATGNSPVVNFNIFEGMRTLSANIAVEMPEAEFGGTHYRILFLAALVLFVLTFFLNTAAELVRQRLRKKYASI
jgi:phosphate transport system permease protein